MAIDYVGALTGDTWGRLEEIRFEDRVGGGRATRDRGLEGGVIGVFDVVGESWKLPAGFVEIIVFRPGRVGTLRRLCGIRRLYVPLVILAVFLPVVLDVDLAAALTFERLDSVCL